MKSFRAKPLVIAASATALLAAVCGGGSAAHGAVISGNSSGYGVNASASVVGSLVTLSAPMLGLSSGTAPAAYSASQTDIAVNAASSLTVLAANVTLAAVNGTVSSTASSTVDGTAGPKLTKGTAEVDNLSTSVGTATVLNVPIASTLQLNGGIISSTASVLGDYPSLAVTGDSTLLGLTLKVGNITIPLSAYVDANGKAAPNTTLGASVLGLAGLTVILNEQLPTASGIAVNAVHIEADAVSTGIAGLGLLTADIEIAHSQAFETAVPEPMTVGTLGLGVVSLLARRRRRTI